MTHLFTQFLESLIKKKIEPSLSIEKGFRRKTEEFLKEFYSGKNFSLKKIDGMNEIKVIPVGEYWILGVGMEREGNRFIHEYNMKRVGRELNFEERPNFEKLEEEEIKQSKSQNIGKEIASEVYDTALGEEKKERHVLISSYTL